MNLRQVVAPTSEPLTLGEAMQAMNVGLDDRHQDAWFNRMITAARQSAEEFLNFALTDAVYEYRVDSFFRRYESSMYGGLSVDCGITLPLGHVGSVLGITYVDPDGATQTLDPTVYAFDDNPRAPRILRAFGQSWPSSRCQPNAIAIQFQGVYSETSSPPNSPPEPIKHAMELMLGHWNENREAVVIGQTAIELPMGAMYLMQPYRLAMGV